MAEQQELAVAPRTVKGKATRHLRKEGIIPANIYGHKEEPLAIQLEALAFEHLRRAHGLRNILLLRLPDGKGTQTALVRKVQHDPVTGKILHIDFGRVSLTERVNVSVPLHFVGEAPGVKIEGGILLHLLDTIQAECAASDLVEFVEVDISSLAQIDDTLFARDVKLPAKYTLVTDPDEAIVKVAAPRTATAEEAAPTEAAPETPATPASE